MTVLPMFQYMSSNRCPFKHWRQTDGILIILLFLSKMQENELEIIITWNMLVITEASTLYWCNLSYNMTGLPMFQGVSSNRCPFKHWRQTDGILIILLFLSKMQ